MLLASCRVLYGSIYAKVPLMSSVIAKDILCLALLILLGRALFVASTTNSFFRGCLSCVKFVAVVCSWFFSVATTTISVAGFGLTACKFSALGASIRDVIADTCVICMQGRPNCEICLLVKLLAQCIGGFCCFFGVCMHNKGKFRCWLLDSKGAAPVLQTGEPLQTLKAQNWRLN